jgi:hypothetical protein
VRKDESEESLSDSEIDDLYAKAVDETVSGRRRPEFIPVGRMPEVLRWLGNEDLPVIIRKNVIDKAREKHEISVENIKLLPKQLRDPLMVFKDGPKSVLILTEIANANGEPVVAAIHLKVDVGNYEINDLASMRKESITKIYERIEEGEMRYWDVERAKDWLKRNDSSVVVTRASPSREIVSTKTEFVKSRGER